MLFRTLGALAVAVPLAAQQPAADTTRVVPASVTPSADQGRALDAELRMALFDVAAAKPLSALARLEALRDSRDAFAASTPEGARAQETLLFLLAESYYRLGMSDAFRSTAQQLEALPTVGRYLGVIHTQLMLDAYRRGDDARVRAIANSGKALGDPALSALVAGLASYRAGDFASARVSFAQAREAGGAYAAYAEYMDALASLHGDTTKAQGALEILRPLAARSKGAFADQVRLTAAELAYEMGQYDAAVSLAEAVTPASGLGAQALLTKAWALYKGGKREAASTAFEAFATRYPQLPQRDQARLMVGQLMLESGHADRAESYFQLVADSIGGEVGALQARTASAMTDASRALVAARAAGIVFVRDPQGGKVVALPDGAGAERALVLAAYAGTAPPASPDAAPAVVSDSAIAARLSELAPRLGADFPRRAVFAPASAPGAGDAYAARAQALTSADVNVALARYRLQEQVGAQRLKVAALQNIEQLIGEGNTNLAEISKELTATQDSLTAMRAVLDRSRTRVRETLLAQIQATRRMAAENAARVDSTRASLGASVGPIESEVLATEARTAATYGQLADDAERGLDALIDRHPVFVLRDSLGVRLARARVLHDSAQAVLAADDQVVKAELARVQGGESPSVRSMRAALATAEAQRTAAEGALVALVDGELRARAGGLLALMRRDREAADYGTASAAFFKAMDAAAARAAAPPTGNVGPADTAAKTPPR